MNPIRRHMVVRFNTLGGVLPAVREIVPDILKRSKHHREQDWP